MDVSASMGYVGKHASCSKLRYASMLAACFSYLAHRQGDRLGLFAYSNEVKEWIRPRAGSGQLNRVYSALHGLKPEGENAHDFGWDRMVSGLPGRAMVVFLSDFLEAEDSLAEKLRFSLSSRYESLCLQVLDPDEIEAGISHSAVDIRVCSFDGAPHYLLPCHELGLDRVVHAHALGLSQRALNDNDCR